MLILTHFIALSIGACLGFVITALIVAGKGRDDD